MQPPNLLDLVTLLFSQIPQPYRAWVLFVVALVVPVSTAVVGVLPVKYKSTWWGKLLWWLSHVTFHDEPGSIKIPFTPWTIRFAKAAPVIAAASMFLFSCGAQQHITSAQVAKVATQVADIACEIAPIGAGVAGLVAPQDVQYIYLTEKGVAVACGVYHAVRSSGGAS